MASEGKVPAQQEEATENPLPSSIEQLLRELLKEHKEVKEKTTKINDRLQALELKQQQISHRENMGPQEEKSGERGNYATDAGGQEITLPEQQSWQAASSSYGPSRFFQMEQPRQQPPRPPSSLPPPLPYHHLQPFSVPESFLASRQHYAIPSAVGKQPHQPIPIAGTRGMSSAGDPITLPWKLNSPVFDSDSLDFRSFRKEATTFPDC